MHSFDPINIEGPVVNTFFKNVSLCNRTFWSSSIGNVSFQFSKVPTRKKIFGVCDFIPRGKDTIDGCIKGSNYRDLEYIHRYCINDVLLAVMELDGQWWSE